MADILILADDLSGAADCGVACAVQGLDTLVVLDHAATAFAADVLAVDAGTRGMTSAQAAAETERLLRCWAREPGPILFKKFDSTLRGHVGVEVAAALRAWRSGPHRNSAIVVAAPAFPATGRTTIGGRQWLNGAPLEADLPQMLEAAGLRTARIGLDPVRAGRLPAVMQAHAAACAALVCDAQTDADLRSIAAAAVSLGPATVWAGSAGLARHLPEAAGLLRPRRAFTLPARSGPILFVVGSPAPLSHLQAAVLPSTNEVVVLTLKPDVLLAGPDTPAWRDCDSLLSGALANGRDVLALVAAQPAPNGDSEGALLCAFLARLVAPYRAGVGALVLTGGETARAVLLAFGVRSLRLLAEVEPGVPLALAAPEGRAPLPVITKAGAFGNRDTLVRCREALLTRAVR